MGIYWNTGSKRCAAPLRVMLNHERQAWRRWHRLSKLGFWGEGGLVEPKLYVPHQNALTKSTSLGCRLDQKWFHCPKLCHLRCTQIISTHFYLFLSLENPLRRNSEITSVRMRTPIHTFCFRNSWNRCRISRWKATWVSWQKKTLFSPLGRTLGAISPNFCECTMWPIIYIQGFIQIRSDFCGVITLKTHLQHPKVNAI